MVGRVVCSPGPLGRRRFCIVASDSEALFDPFNYGADTSDGLNFSNVPHVWNLAAGNGWVPNGFQTWVLPANLTSIGCGVENETPCEPPGVFVRPRQKLSHSHDNICLHLAAHLSGAVPRGYRGSRGIDSVFQTNRVTSLDLVPHWCALAKSNGNSARAR